MKLRSFSIRLRLLSKKLFIDIRHTHLKDLRNVFLLSLKKLPDVVHLKNLVLFSSIMAFLILALFVQRFASLSAYYLVEKPDFGGSYSQGVVGTIDRMNPLFAQNDAEKAANLLIYSGLTRVVNGNEVVPDLADSWTISQDNKVYSFKLKKNVKWHDDISFSGDDVLFTVKLLQDANTRTPLESVWKGVKAEKVNDLEVKFTLASVYPNFLTVASQAILPMHLLSSIDSQNIKVAGFNSDPVGTGPYKFVRFDQLGSQPEAIFKRNDKFQISKPYLDQFKLVMYENEKTIFEGLTRKQIDGVFSISPEMYKDLGQVSGFASVKKKLLPEYQTVYFNLKNPILSDKDLRVALSSAVDRQELIDKTLSGYGQKQTTLLLPGQPGYDPKVKGIDYNSETSNASLEKLGWVKGSDGIRTKDGKKLSFRLILPDNYESREDAKLLKSEFLRVGVNLELIISGQEQIGSNYVKPRNFDLLLISQNVGFANDYYSLWSSTQATSPGMNLSGFSDKALDRFVEQVRKSSDKKYISDRMKQAEQIIVDQAPVIYLYRPTHLYSVAERLKGADQTKLSLPIDILNNVYKWYVNVKS
jgi:peptide/nickel transport system substrate-binding protein